MKRNFSYFFLMSVLMILCSAPLAVGEEAAPQEIAGEIFGAPVPIGNYYFAKRTLLVFGTKWGPEPTNAEELENLVWENLLLSFEAFRRGIEVSQEELDSEIANTLKNEKLDFNWKEDKDAFGAWLKEKVNEDSELFSNQLRYLIQMQKLRQQVLDSITPQVSEEEAFQEYLNEYNTLETELAQFEDKKVAELFYKRVKSKPKLWEKETKDNPKLFRRPGFVALEFLMDMWKYPKEDLYKMLEVKAGTIYPPIPIYSGKFGVVKVLKVRKAEKGNFPELRQSYYEQIKAKKKYDGLGEWLKKLKEEANIKVFVKPPEAAAPSTEKKD